jgi:hypothetical protein
MLTCGRPEVLRGALDSLSAETEGVPIGPITVYDDSREASVRSVNESIVHSFAAQSGLALSYGTTETISPEGPAQKQSAFALGLLPFPHAPAMPGAARNAILLSSVGKKVLSFDDDIRFLLREPRFAMEEGSPLPFAFAASGTESFPDSVSRPLVSGAVRCFELFDSVLGRTPRCDGMAEGDSEAAADLHSPVRAAMAGICGDRWFSSPLALFDTQPFLRKRAWPNRRSYRRAGSDPIALLLAPELSYTSHPFFIASCYGFDASEILPPFFPHIRNEDGVWAFLLRASYPDAPIAHLPFAFEHKRGIHPPFRSEHRCSGIGAGTVVQRLLSFFSDELKAPEASDRLLALGMRLSWAASLPLRQWKHLLLELHLKHEGAMVARLEADLEQSGGSPGFWAKDLRSFLDRYLDELPASTPSRPREFHHLGDGAESAFQRFVGSCGELLCAWPEIWEGRACL